MLEPVKTSERPRRGRYPFLPDDPEIGWTPYLWLLYLGFFVIDPIMSHASLGEWLALAGVLALFLPLYFLGYWARNGRQLLLVVGAITLLAVVYLPYNLSAWGLFIYAAAYLGFGFRPARALALLGVILAVIVTQGLLLGLPAWTWGAGAAMTAIIGASNVHFAEVRRKNLHLKAAREEVERLAKGAERERIARDLHDLLGHTLTVIAVKSELAARLADKDPERSREEIREVHRISRHALTEVRRAVQGYRTEGSAGLALELASARGALASAEVDVEVRLGSGPLEEIAAAAGADREEALALALREAVTNVLRHARARQCRISLERVDDRILLEVADDGRASRAGDPSPDGAGLTGMRERIEALGGSVERRTRRGTTLRVDLPLPEAPAEERERASGFLPRPAVS